MTGVTFSICYGQQVRPASPSRIALALALMFALCVPVVHAAGLARRSQPPCLEQEALTKELYSEILTIEHLLQCALVDVPEPLLRRKITYAVRSAAPCAALQSCPAGSSGAGQKPRNAGGGGGCSHFAWHAVALARPRGCALLAPLVTVWPRRRYVHDELVKPHRKAVDSPFAFGTAYNDLVRPI